jgi:hypothetical protein
MDIKELKGYGLAVSDLEGSWSPEFKARIKKKIAKDHPESSVFCSKNKIDLLLSERETKSFQVGFVRPAYQRNDERIIHSTAAGISGYVFRTIKNVGYKKRFGDYV